MKKILILGGTRFLGIEFINLIQKEDIDLYVASRREVDVKNFLFIDRKNKNSLDRLFSEHNFDIIIDFICYSGLDSKVLIDVLASRQKFPKLIVISSTYTYSEPQNLSLDSVFKENNFLAENYEASLIDRPDVTYSNGKRAMESYFTKNYSSSKLIILRFPIILGIEDYTLRTQYYFNKIKFKEKINPENINNSTNYIFSFEAAIAILNFIKHDHCGTYNVALEPVSEKELIELYCSHFNLNSEELLDQKINSIRTPFSTNFNFLIDSSKYSDIFPFSLSFKDCLKRELSKM